MIIYPYALCGVNEEMLSFYVQDSGLAGSLEKRNFEGVEIDTIKEIHVSTACLSKYIDKKVDYLKLDIEGSETKVLEEIGKKINKIEHLFIEFHEGHMKAHNYISRITLILEENGFDINIAKSLSSGRNGCWRSMKNVGGRVSEIIWAKRKHI